MRLFIWIAVALLVITAFATEGHSLFAMGWPFWLVLGLLSWAFDSATGFVVPIRRQPPQ